MYDSQILQTTENYLRGEVDFGGLDFIFFHPVFRDYVVVSLLIMAVLLYFETLYKMKGNCRTNFVVRWPTSLNFPIEINCLNKATTMNAYIFLSIFRYLLKILVSYLKSCGSIFFPNIYGLKWEINFQIIFG